MKLHDIRLSTRITVITLLIMAVSATVFLFFERSHHREVYISEQNADLEKNLQFEKLRLNQTINTLRRDVLFLSNIPPVFGIMRATLNHGYDARDSNTRAKWEDRLNEIFSAFSAAHPDYYLISYIGVADGGKEIGRVDNRDGRIDITPPGKLAARGSRDDFKASLELQKGQIWLSEFDLSPDSGDPPKRTLRAATPVFTAAGVLFGMVVVNLDIGRLLESATLGLPSGTQAYITNRDGQYLLHPDSQRAFKLEPGSKGEIAADFPFIKTMFDPQAADYLPLQDLATKAGKYAAASRIHFDPAHPERFLLVMYHIPDAVAASHISSLPVEDIVAGFAAMLLVGGIALLVLRRTFSPLEQIAAAADKITAGNQNISLPKIGGGEIGGLTGALGAMLEKLKQREKLLQESESKYRHLHESMMDAFVMVDMQGRLIEFNSAYQEMLGYSTEELQRLTYIDLTPEKWREAEARIIAEQVIPQGYSQVYEKEYLRKDGTAFPVELKAFLLRDANGQPEAMWAIVRDITGRKQADDALRKSETMLRESQRMAQIGSWELDLVHNILSWSDENYRIFGIDRTRFGATYEAFLNTVHPDDRAMVSQAYTESVKSRTPYDIVHRLLFPDQRIKYVREWCESVYDPEGRPIRSIGTTQDVTERTLAENALRASESRYRLLVESAPFCIHEIDLEGRLQSMNRAGLDMLCLDDASKIYGVPYLGAVSQQDAGRIGALLQDAIANGTPSHFEFTAAGEVPLYFKSCFIPIKDASGKVLKLMGITEDITERKAAEDMLRFHSNILKSMMEGIYLVRASDGVIVFTNPQFESMFGYGHGELIGKHVSVVTAPGAQGSEAMAAAMMSELARTGVWSGEVRNIRKDGTTFWCHATVSAFDHPLFCNVWVSVHKDITERKQFEEMRAKLANAGRFNIAGETAASLTHELSQPLTACNNYLDVCLRRIDDQDWCKEKLRETLQLAYKQAGRVGEIINYFKKQVRRPELEYTRFDVNLLARDVMAFLAGEIKRQGVSMHMVLFHLPQVMACREEIRQVLLSLCENAIEAMHSSAQRELYVTTRIIEPDHVMVAVSDSGEGVLPARMKTLFEPFQTSREGGLGLSLSICRSIIEKHGGRIWADPQRESGAEFYFTLPIRVHHE